MLFDLIHDDQICPLKKWLWKRSSRCSVEAEQGRALTGCFEDRIVSYLELAQDRVEPLGINVAGSKIMVGTRSNHDLVLASLIYHDQGDTCGPTCHCGQSRQIDAALSKEFQRFLGKSVIADRSNKGDICALPTRRECLIGPLSTRMTAEDRLTYGLTWCGQMGATGDKVEVDAPNHTDADGSLRVETGRSIRSSQTRHIESRLMTASKSRNSLICLAHGEAMSALPSG